MNSKAFESKLQELSAQIETLPESDRARLRALADETRRRQSDIRASCARAEEALCDWRLLLKYILFDAEASLREQRQRQRREGSDPPPPDDT